MQKVEILVFNNNLKPAKMGKASRPAESQLFSASSQSRQPSSRNLYTLKDLTQKNADIKKILTEISPSKFSSPKTG